MKSQAGFTLVEALTGGIISTVLAGSLLAMVNFVGVNLKASAAHSRLERLQSVASEQIRMSTRKANGVKFSDSEPGSIDSLAEADNMPHGPLNMIWLYGGLDSSKAYRISGNYLEEQQGGAWVKMTVGPDTVMLDGPASSFTILSNRKGVAIDLRYEVTENGQTYRYPTLVDSVLCRGKI